MATKPRHRPSCGTAGTVTAYNRGCRCARCTTANTEAQREKRARRKKRGTAPHLSIVEDVPHASDAEVHDDHPPPVAAPSEPSTTSRTARTLGLMEKAVEEDLEAIDVALRVPFHNTLSKLALETAREIDEPATSPTARRDARKQLFEVLRSLRTQKEGGDDSALTLLLEEAGIGTPLVPGRPA